MAIDLPDNLPFQRPQKYTKKEMATILAAEKELKITSVKVIRYDDLQCIVTWLFVVYPRPPVPLLYLNINYIPKPMIIIIYLSL